MVTASFINRLTQAIDLIEERKRQKDALKIVKVRRGWQEDQDVALERHFAAHPEDRDADVVLFHFCDIEAEDEGKALAWPATPTRE